jgi:hypothetical protein
MATQAFTSLIAVIPTLAWVAQSLLWRGNPEFRLSTLAAVFLITVMISSLLMFTPLRDYWVAGAWVNTEAFGSRVMLSAMSIGSVTTSVLLSTQLISYRVWSTNKLVSGAAASITAGLGYSLVTSFHFLAANPSTYAAVAAITSLVWVNTTVTVSLLIGIGVDALHRGERSLMTLPFILVASVIFLAIATELVRNFSLAAFTSSGAVSSPWVTLFMAVGLSVLPVMFHRIWTFNATANDTRQTGQAYPVGMSPFSSGQRWNLALSVTLLATFLMLGRWSDVQGSTATTRYSDPQSGISAQYPRNWLLDTTGPFVFRVSDLASPGFKTSITVSTRRVSSNETARLLFDDVSLKRAQTLTGYAILGEEQLELEPGLRRDVLTYSYVWRNEDPFAEGVPYAVLGQDVIIFDGDRAILVTFESNAGEFSDNLEVFRSFLRTFTAR